MGKPAVVHVEYCGAWGYESRYEALRQQILRRVPDSTVTGKTGRRSSFEVTLNNKAIYSKLENGNFPVFDKIVEEVENAAEGRDVQIVTEADKSSSCSIL